ncbi:MAG: CdaR family protein [Anaerolineales bacterium]|jgi:YbbR domain-containing protein|nr:CdaR family protein [Anaerolineales bacterium]
MFKWIIRNLSTFLLAFFLAVTVWIMAVIAADPDETRNYPRNLTLEVTGQDPRLIITNDLPRQVNLSLRAPQSVWDVLATETQVRAIIDLAGLGAGTHRLPIQLQIGLSPVRVVSLVPEEVDVTLEALGSRSLPIDVLVTGQPAIGYQAGKVEASQQEVNISGPESLIARAVKAQAEIKIEGGRATIGLDAPIKILDEDGNVLNGIIPNIEKVFVQVSITQQGGYRDIAVKVVVRGQPANGYRLTNISVTPPAITVYSGDPNLVAALPGFVETEPLNLNGASRDIELSLSLNLPAGISVVGEQTVLVEVGIEALQGSLSLANMPVTVVGLSSGLGAQIAPETVDIILTGPLPLLEKLTANDIRITLDLTDMGIGSYQVAPLVEILIANIDVQSIFPGAVEVVISVGGIPTP